MLYEMIAVSCQRKTEGDGIFLCKSKPTLNEIFSFLNCFLRAYIMHFVVGVRVKKMKKRRTLPLVLVDLLQSWPMARFLQKPKGQGGHSLNS